MQNEAVRYLNQLASRFDAVVAELPRLIEMGEVMAAVLLAGGEMSIPEILPAWCSEFRGRAGGMMAVRDFPRAGHKDAAYIALRDPRRWDAARDETLARLMASDARIFVNGRREELADAGIDVSRFSGFTGGPAIDEGWGKWEAISPLVSFRYFEQFVRGWVVFGEMVAACIRAGKMPVLWMSVWLEGAFVRNAHFIPQGNRREPWLIETFHENMYILPLAPGHVAREFIAEARKIHQGLVQQSPLLAKAADWMAQAKKDHHRVNAVATGHSYPLNLEIPGETAKQRRSNYPVEWDPSVSDLNKAVPQDLGEGDVALHFGYAPVDVEDVQRILDRGVRFIYTSPYGRPSVLKDHPNLLWLDLPWRPADATVDIPGYSVRLLPMSSTAHSMGYFAIMAELVQKMGWK